MRVLSPCAGVSRQRSRSQPSRSPAFTMQIKELERQGEFSFRALGSLVSDRNPQDTGPVSTTQIRELERQGEFSFRAPGSLVSDGNLQDIDVIRPAFTMQIRELERQGEFSLRALGPQGTGGNDHTESGENITTRQEFNASEKLQAAAAAVEEVVQVDAAEPQAEHLLDELQAKENKTTTDAVSIDLFRNSEILKLLRFQCSNRFEHRRDRVKRENQDQLISATNRTYRSFQSALVILNVYLIYRCQ